MSEQSTGEPQAAPPVPKYGLRWGIKASFLGYVARMPDGRAYVGDGAAANERNELVFPLAKDSPTEGETFSFGGDVRFSGHFGMLFVQIAQPQVVVRGGEGELTVLDPSSDDGKRLRLVTFGLAGPRTEDDAERWDAAEVRLTPEGVELFGDVYQPGEPFDPLTITVPRRA